MIGGFKRILNKENESGGAVTDPTTLWIESSYNLTWRRIPTNDPEGEIIKTGNTSTVSHTFITEEQFQTNTGLDPSYVSNFPFGQTITKPVTEYKVDFNWNNSVKKLEMEYLVDVTNFKSDKLQSGAYAFQGAIAFQGTALSTLNTTNLTTLENAFKGCHVLNKPLPWDTKNITNMKNTFQATWSYKQNLSGWCVENLAQPTSFSPVSYANDETPETIPPEKQPQWQQPC